MGSSIHFPSLPKKTKNLLEPQLIISIYELPPRLKNVSLSSVCAVVWLPLSATLRSLSQICSCP